MKKLLIIFFVLISSTALGLYFRPSYPLVGQLDWINVLSKGYFVGSIKSFFTQSYIDESFWYVMRFSAGGLAVGVITSLLLGGGKKVSKKAK